MPDQSSVITRLLHGLFDDASLFPPAGLPMPDAVAGHIRHQAAWYRDMSGPFVCPRARIAELGTVLSDCTVQSDCTVLSDSTVLSDDAGQTGIDLSLIVTGGAEGVGPAIQAVAADPRLRLRAVEAGLPAGAEPGRAAADVSAALDEALPDGVAGYIELPLAVLADDTLASTLLGSVALAGYRPKLRTGGVTAAAFPDEPTLAAALLAVISRRLPFKCTAGLHHAVRHTAAGTGFEHHGFVNVLLAVAAAADGADPGQVAAVLAERDAGPLTSQLRDLDEDRSMTVRGLFTSFGTCSTSEPVADLVALGLADPGPAAAVPSAPESADPRLAGAGNPGQEPR